MQNPEAAPAQTEYITAIHNKSETNITYIRESVSLHTHESVLIHVLFRSIYAFSFCAKCLKNHKTSKILRQIRTKHTISCLHILVKLLHNTAEQCCEYKHKSTSGKEYHRKSVIQHEKHRRRAGQLNKHCNNSWNNLHEPICHNNRIISNSVQQFSCVIRCNSTVFS